MWLCSWVNAEETKDERIAHAVDILEVCIGITGVPNWYCQRSGNRVFQF